MSKLAKKPILVPNTVVISGFGTNEIKIEGEKGILTCIINQNVCKINLSEKKLFFIMQREDKYSLSQLGTIYSLIRNAIIGVSHGYSKKLVLVGIGYKASIKENILQLSVGFSHIIHYTIPKHIKATCLTHNEILLEGIDKQLVGQVAANIYFFRPPEVYKGKGIRYEDQILIMKETKKK